MKTLLYAMVPRGTLNASQRQAALQQLDRLRDELNAPKRHGSVRITSEHTVETIYAIADVLSQKFPLLAFEVDNTKHYRTYTDGHHEEW